MDNFSPEKALVYEQGWKALNRLLHEDRSFSGHEKNCAYVNMGGGNFADASYATGVNFPDDGRGLALVDWDFDGDLDFWTTNRTAPRVRLMKNTTDSMAFVTVRLEGNGKTTNRDAIGARLRLYLKGEATPRLRSLRTSEGFLSMSSNWIHFGLGAATAIERLEVDWPGGGTEYSHWPRGRGVLPRPPGQLRAGTLVATCRSCTNHAIGARAAPRVGCVAHLPSPPARSVRCCRSPRMALRGNSIRS